MKYAKNRFGQNSTSFPQSCHVTTEVPLCSVNLKCFPLDRDSQNPEDFAVYKCYSTYFIYTRLFDASIQMANVTSQEISIPIRQFIYECRVCRSTSTGLIYIVGENADDCLSCMTNSL